MKTMKTEKTTVHQFSRGPLSQWYPAKFEVNDIEYHNSEQYMMAEKARLFGDRAQEKLIMEHYEPRSTKALGRGVRGFNNDAWNTHKEEIVYRGNYAKFEQNESIREHLLSTDGSVLAEAAPGDLVWGTGWVINDPHNNDPVQWRGQNLLGKALMRVRDELRAVS